MTDEELDRERTTEATRRANDDVVWGKSWHDRRFCHYRELVRENWTPPEPVDPDLLVVREIVATAPEYGGGSVWAAEVRAGVWDCTPQVQFPLSVYKAGREKERNNDL